MTIETAIGIAYRRWALTNERQAVVDLDDGGEFGERTITVKPLSYIGSDEFKAFDGRVIEYIP